MLLPGAPIACSERSPPIMLCGPRCADADARASHDICNLGISRASVLATGLFLLFGLFDSRLQAAAPKQLWWIPEPDSKNTESETNQPDPNP